MTHWFVFAGLALGLMGVGLLADASRQQRELSLGRAFRWAGASLAVVGIALLAGAAIRPDALAAHFKLRPFGRSENLAAGAAFFIAGAAWAWSKRGDAGWNEFAFLGDESGPRAGRGERLASLCGWLLAALFMAFGGFLLVNSAR